MAALVVVVMMSGSARVWDVWERSWDVWEGN